MEQHSDISLRELQFSIIRYGIINAIGFFLVMIVLRFLIRNAAGLLVALNCLQLCLLSFYQLRRIAVDRGRTMKALRAFSMVFFTGCLAFVLLSGMMIVYSYLDPGIANLIMGGALNQSRLVPVLIVGSEGVGGSIIIALLATFYSNRFDERKTR